MTNVQAPSCKSLFIEMRCNGQGIATGTGIIHVRRSEWRGQVTLPKSGRERQIEMTERLKAALGRNRHLRDERVLWRDGGTTATLR